MRWALTGIALACAACTGNTYLPGQPGSLNTDLSGAVEREEWVEMHPEIDSEVREAVLQGVFINGMNTDAIRAISNPRRGGVGGDAYWRNFGEDAEVRSHWYIANQRQPFVDGRGRLVCELVMVEDMIQKIRYCNPVPTDGGQD